MIQHISGAVWPCWGQHHGQTQQITSMDFGIDFGNRHQYRSNSGFVVSKKSEIPKLSTGFESWIDALPKDKSELLWFILPDHSGAQVTQGIENAVHLSIHHHQKKGRVIFKWQERSKAWRNPLLQQLATGYGGWHQACVSWTDVHAGFSKHYNNATNFLSNCRID
eukprot:3210784-Karenia_brevis.AAC.1